MYYIISYIYISAFFSSTDIISAPAHIEQLQALDGLQEVLGSGHAWNDYGITIGNPMGLTIGLTILVKIMG